MKDNNLKDLFQFLLNHKKLIQCGITVSQGSYSITDLNEGVCVLVERNVPFKEYLSFLEIMDKWPEKNNDRGYTVRIEKNNDKNIKVAYRGKAEHINSVLD
ncbi:hypothetical protein ACRCLE_18955, partial [Acinetobacter baumannii]|uniref:hypothetical protein n=1 Tax=Acinetobacter baumannii TaxID=470 RepID=UPI003D6B09ED